MSISDSDTLAPLAMSPLPLGHIRPAGWLLRQLRIQAEGLTGHLDEFWPDIAESGWIGGKGESWERGPYWLDGLVPLAFLLDDERLKAKEQRWMDYIITHQHHDGWLGPLQDVNYGYKYDPWPVYVLLKAMTQYQEASGDMRVISAMQRFFHRLQALLEHEPLHSWAQLRSSDLLISIYWLHGHTGEGWLLDLARTVLDQEFDWPALFEDFPYKDKQNAWRFQSHVVNNAMALKQPATWYRLTNDTQTRQFVKRMITTLGTYHGQATGLFTGDEVVAGKNPSQGTELCAVVEYMFSLETLLTTFGDSFFADRLERIAFNALAATFKPDMWAHQYVQQANQVLCVTAQDRLYTTNGPDANLFGLEPNFGCCTANMHQGWPKFTEHLWMSTPDAGLAAVVYAPCIVTTQIAGVSVRVQVDTDYPFADEIQITITADQPVCFPLHLRVPAWSENAALMLPANRVEALQVGAFHRIEQAWGTSTTLTLRLPAAIKTQTRYNDSISIERGPLIFALKIDEKWQQIRGQLPHADWEVHPASPWNYALQIDRAHPEFSCVLERHTLGEQLFSPEGAPLHLTMQGRRLPTWTVEHNAAGTLPTSPVQSTEPLEPVTLIPYGCTNLRVTEFPVLKD